MGLETGTGQSKLEGRLQLLRKNLEVTHLTDEEKEAIVKLYEVHDDLFNLEGDKLTHNDAVEHSIPILPKYQGRVIKNLIEFLRYIRKKFNDRFLNY